MKDRDVACLAEVGGARSVAKDFHSGFGSKMKIKLVNEIILMKIFGFVKDDK